MYSRASVKILQCIPPPDATAFKPAESWNTGKIVVVDPGTAPKMDREQ
ncbi:MAG: hypothetical protein J7619_27775 [Dyadobacter sp.]|nr:hypothetical protein [Dyadobacter sp.]MBO9616519.1 hypothetical protein [Dyadobacter sp.]